MGRIFCPFFVELLKSNFLGRKNIVETYDRGYTGQHHVLHLFRDKTNLPKRTQIHRKGCNSIFNLIYVGSFVAPNVVVKLPCYCTKLYLYQRQ